MGEGFRETMLSDMGNPRLKQAVLGLITKLRFENNLLNHNKSGPAKNLCTTIGGDSVETAPVHYQDESEMKIDDIINEGGAGFRKLRDGSFVARNSTGSFS